MKMFRIYNEVTNAEPLGGKVEITNAAFELMSVPIDDKQKPLNMLEVGETQRRIGTTADARDSRFTHSGGHVTYRVERVE